jgi:hypothetical protein
MQCDRRDMTMGDCDGFSSIIVDGYGCRVTTLGCVYGHGRFSLNGVLHQRVESLGVLWL